MHGFWRAAIAVGAGVMWFAVIILPLLAFGAANLGFGAAGGLLALGVFVSSYGICIAVYDGLTRQWHPTYGDQEIHCRKCGHILRGITEPQCPECGERI